MQTTASNPGYEGLLPFRQGLFTVGPDGSGYLIGNRCQRCGVTFFPRREFCIACYRSDDLAVVGLDTEGTLYTFTTVFRATPDFKTPYVVGYIDLAKNGVRIFAPITGCRPEELRIGMKMKLVFGQTSKLPQDENDKNRLTYQFRPTGASHSTKGLL